jgi:hypothetical protein
MTEIAHTIMTRLNPFVTILFIAGLAVAVSGQSETLTNSEIVEMVRAGLSQEVVLRKIGTANSKFDVSAAALIELKKAQVPDEVISAMIDRQEILPPNSNVDKTPAYSESGTLPNAFTTPNGPALGKKELIATAKTIALVKSSAHPSRQALEKELMKRPEFIQRGLTLTRYKDTADLYVEIGYVSLSWITHRYVYRIYDRRSGTVLAAGETTSWGSLAENLAKNIAKSLGSIG